ncbi:uncharacterized protein LOC117794250 [Drosophila innubila]|uniref:uncharacterized protein LOC117794250 n=1 Tax=Drosophila innubila TaxID=198719 RepID=UPI00148D7D33|nr:uncharacterized protein LOC117794250 [Drosophila innubila]
MRKLQIQVLTRDGRKSIYETDRFRNVADLKKRIGRTMNVPMAFSRLTYKGRLLTNGSILEDEGVKRMSTLELHWQPLVLTPKQYREKELELDKQDLKQRHVSRIVDSYDQTVKKGIQDRTPSAVRRTCDQLKDKRSPSSDDIKEPQQQQPREHEPEEQSSASSDELDFLAAYWCCPKSDSKKRSKAVDYEPNIKKQDSNANLRADAKKLDIICELQSSVSCSEHSCNKLKEADDDLLVELLEQRCLGCKHQPFRTGIRLTAGRMSHSIISNIRKNIKNCKK